MKLEGWIVLGSDGKVPSFITGDSFRLTKPDVEGFINWLNDMKKMGPWAKKPYRAVPATLEWEGKQDDEHA